ncbi:hypothetical protein LINPERPRIM_LOCUS39068 [Linum perenne]
MAGPQHLSMFEKILDFLSALEDVSTGFEFRKFMYGWERGAYNLDGISELIMSYDDRFQHLRMVTLHGLMGSLSEKEFRKILLARASVLEDLHIFTDVEIAMSDVKEIFEYSVSLGQLGVTVDGVSWGHFDDFN